MAKKTLYVVKGSQCQPRCLQGCLWCNSGQGNHHSKAYFPYPYSGDDNSPLSGRTRQGNPHGDRAHGRSSINYYAEVLKLIWECGGVWPHSSQILRNWEINGHPGPSSSREVQGLRWKGGPGWLGEKPM